MNTEQLQWLVAVDEWDRFVANVEEEWGTAGRAGVAIEQAWRECSEDHPLEDCANRLLVAVGRSSTSHEEKNPATVDSLGDKETKKVGVSVRSEIKEEMKQHADECGVQYHEVLRKVLWWYIDGGRDARLLEKLEPVSDDVERLAATEDSDGHGETAAEKKERWLADSFIDDDGTPKPFTREEFGDALEEMPFTGGDTTHMNEKWLPKVLDRLDMTEHPRKADLYVTVEEAAEYGDDDGGQGIPAIDRRDYADLTDDERVLGLRLKLAEAAADRHRGKFAWKPTVVQRQAFDDVPGTRKVKDLMDKAARADGFRTDVKDAKRLCVDLGAVTDPAVLTRVADAADEPPDDITTLARDEDETAALDSTTDTQAEIAKLRSATPANANGNTND